MSNAFDFQDPTQPIQAGPPARTRPRPASSPKNKSILIAVGGGGLMLLVLVVVAWMFLGRSSQNGPAGPSAGPSVLASVVGGPAADNWTYKELLAHINSKSGTKLKMVNARCGTVFSAADNDHELSVTVIDYYHDNGIEYPGVLVSQMRDAEGARQAAGRTNRDSISWGRWFIKSMKDDKVMNQVKSALK